MAAEFRVLGPVEVHAGGLPIDIGPARQRCVLAVLLHEANRWVSVDQLVERVWGGSELPRQPRSTAQMYVSMLRRALAPVPDVAIVRGQGGYRMDVDDSLVDVRAFLVLLDQARIAGDGDRAVALYEQALGLWTGDAFGNLDTPWIAGVRASLDRQRREAERDLADLWLSRNGLPGARLARMAAWAEEFPLDERLAGQLMLALFRSGRQADALEHYEKLRRQLADGLGTDPGHAVRELRQRILTDDPALAAAAATGEAVGAAAVAAESVIPRQLPAAPRWFTGRRAELAALLSQAGHPDGADGTGGVVVISAIDGMAGVGKSALAVLAAHRLAEKFPDGQLFLDLHGYSQTRERRPPGDALDWLLRALGLPPQRIPQDVEERAALYRQRLAGTRTLIVLDNAADEAQVRPLLPGHAGCLVLVTSRRRLRGLDDGHSLSLDVLPRSDAIALLRTVAAPADLPADESVLAELAELCGRLPLALRIAAALLRHRPTWTPEHLAALLRGEHQRVDAFSDGERDLGSVFDLSYNHLTDAHRRLFRLMGLVPGPDADVYAAAALADIDPDTAGRLLEDLVDHNVLVQDAPWRYRMHDLVRLYARSLADSDPVEERDEARARLLHYYAYTAQSASRLTARHPVPRPDGPAPAHAPVLPDADAARAWLRAEYSALDAAFAQAHARGLDAHTVALAAGLAAILRADGPLARALTVHQAAVETAERRSWRAALADALTNLGLARFLGSEYAQAQDILTRALEIYRETGDRLGEANALNQLGRVGHIVGEFAEATDCQLHALKIYRETGSRTGEANALNDLGTVRHLVGEFSGAADAHARALEIYRETGNRLGEANALNQLGRVRCIVGEFAQAADAFARAFEIFCEIGNRTGEANALTELGHARCLTGEFARAVDALTRALEIYRETGNRFGEAAAMTRLGRARCLTGEFAGAVDAQTRALEIYRETGNRSNEAWALNHYAATLAAAGDRPRALVLYRQALAMNRELNKPDDEAISLEGIADHHLAAGDTAEGTDRLRQALKIYQQLGMHADVDRIQARLTAASDPRGGPA